MKVTLTELPHQKLRLEIEAGWGEIAADYDDAVTLHADAPVPGFRHGNAPRPLIENYHRREICAAAARTAASRLTRDTLRRDALRTVGAIIIADATLKPGKPLRFTAELTRRPEIPLPDYAHIPAPIGDFPDDNQPDALRDTIADWLVAHTDFDIPRHLIAEQLDPEDPGTHPENGQHPPHDPAIENTAAWREAEQRARLLVITHEIAQREGIELLAADLDKRIAALAQGTGMTPQAFRRQLETTRSLESLRDFLLAENVLDYIAETHSRPDAAPSQSATTDNATGPNHPQQ